MRPHLSIILPAYNEEKLLPATLQALQEIRQCFITEGFLIEIIVCDNNSTDGTNKVAREHGVTVVFEPINQISRARNAGAAAAQAPWLLFLDADSVPTYGLLQELRETMQRPEIMGGGATLRTSGGTLPFYIVLFCWNVYSRLANEAAGAFLFARTHDFHAVGGFPTNLYAAEEIQFVRALKRWGRPQGMRCTILHKHPLHTSARKAKLYSIWEWIRFFLRSAFSFTRNLRSREECHLWYDGRR